MQTRVFATIALLAALAAPAIAQETRAQLAGTITDPQGAAVPGAAVTVTNIETNTALRLRTNSTGYYEANLLLPGNYMVEVEAAGFKKLTRKGIVLGVGARHCGHGARTGLPN